MKKVFIWLDDERVISPQWIGAADEDVDLIQFSNPHELISWLNTEIEDYNKVYISFDHDLGYDLTGYDVAKYIVENNIKIDGFTVHSMNPVGAKNIIDLLSHYGYHKIMYRQEINQ
jgi:hypothetical protein